MSDARQTIEALLDEQRRFPPPDGLNRRAVVGSGDVYREARADVLAWWAKQAERLVWRRRWDEVLDWSRAPFARWFAGGRLNVTESCLDRHLPEHADRVAYYWEGEPGDRKIITYGSLHAEVCRLANALAALGVQKGDRVALYMGMVPELPATMLACARLGAPHVVVFGGFSAEALADRIADAGAKVLVTCDGAWRAGQVVPLKATADEALSRAPSVRHVLVVRRTGGDVPMLPGRDHYYDELVSAHPPWRPATECDAEDVLFILHTSGTTAKPKGIVHTCGGYLTYVTTTHSMVFDVHEKDDIYWCTADIGWITGHSYAVYAPLANGTTSVLYEGAPSHPDKDRVWDTVERYGITTMYTAPSEIRTCMKWGDSYLARHDLSSLRLLGTVGEPINPEAWMWYRDIVGSGRCPVVDTWWQTETGGLVIAPLPGVTTTKPGSATLPLPGVAADVVDGQGRSVAPGEGGYLVITEPWPGMLRGIDGDEERFFETYWRRFSRPEEGRWVFFSGDGAKRDSDGYFWLLGRVDDVMCVSGHRISTLEVESALVDHPAVAEAAVVGRSDPETGQAITAFVTLRSVVEADDDLAEELRAHVSRKIGAIARPSSVVFADELPKTRSGEIMRRLLRDISERRELGDLTTLADAGVVQDIVERAKAGRAATG
jgi:acetyl-CoA synthetase